jgi:hypothetical protein
MVSSGPDASSVVRQRNSPRGEGASWDWKLSQVDGKHHLRWWAEVDTIRYSAHVHPSTCDKDGGNGLPATDGGL